MVLILGLNDLVDQSLLFGVIHEIPFVLFVLVLVLIKVEMGLEGLFTTTSLIPEFLEFFLFDVIEIFLTGLVENA